ncbi:MAG: hypothetical protein WBC17_05505 [Mycobacterium sp.]|nr:hypothetical protein [Mycobacterium sp.]
MRRLVLALGGAVVAAAAAAILGTGAGSADPDANNLYNVVGEPYAKAVALLRAQGVRASFGGSMGSDFAQAQCIVSRQKATGARMTLWLDCSEEAQPEAPAATSVANTPGDATAGGRPTPGAPGVVTVIATPVG